MRYTLSRNADAWAGEGSALRYGDVIAYGVGGMPAGESARITRFMGDDGHEWRVMRIKGNTQGNWTGHFRNPDNALAWLQSEIDPEQALPAQLGSTLAKID